MDKNRKAFVVTMSYFALLIGAALILLRYIFKDNSLFQVLDLILNVLMFSTIALAAFDYCKSKKTVWVVLYWVAVVVVLLVILLPAFGFSI